MIIDKPIGHNHAYIGMMVMIGWRCMWVDDDDGAPCDSIISYDDDDDDDGDDEDYNDDDDDGVELRVRA